MHTLQNRFYYSDNCLADLRSAFPLLIQAIEGSDINCIAFPDEGAEKRFGAYFKKAFPDMELVTCGKHRDPNDPTVRNVVIKDGDPTGKNVIIVDDMVQSGGTLYNCGKQLLANGAKGVVRRYLSRAFSPSNSFTHVLSRPLIKRLSTLRVLSERLLYACRLSSTLVGAISEGQRRSCDI